MCGIAGVLSQSERELGVTVGRMVTAIRYRGPDDSGVWTDLAAGIGLGHARLSILDLSPEGHQPMTSATGRYVLAYNGEVYNFAELRADLETCGAVFRGHSDTEVILAAFEAWGIDTSVQRFVGMFAFALWDRVERRLHLVRDRLGIKPLYFGWVGSSFVFASELKAIRSCKEFDPVVDRGALALYMRLAYVPAPHSIYRGVYKLMPGCMFTIELNQALSRKSFSASPDDMSASWRPTRYWSARHVAEEGTRHPLQVSEADALVQLESLLRRSIKSRMVADVPLGAFLSGGVDSSLVTALMQSQSRTPVRTFTIGFNEEEYNEAIHAKKVAAHLGTDHTELYVAPEQARAVIYKLPDLYDEPFGDSSEIPTFLVSELARRHVTVALSGDGGDELFAGYNRYFLGRRLWRRIGRLPECLRHGIAQGIRAFSPESLSTIFHALRFVVPSMQSPGDKLHKLAEILATGDADMMYLGLVSLWKDPATVVIDGREPMTTLMDRKQWARLDDFTLRMMYQDLVTYLPDDILTKVDRASMAVSLEARVPLLDHRLVEFAWRLPLSMKIRREGEGKWLLRRVLDRYIPSSLIERPKMGFGVPIDQWLRGPLREWAEDLLAESRLRQEGYFFPEPIRNKWEEHLSGRRNWQYLLWNVLMFQSWLKRS